MAVRQSCAVFLPDLSMSYSVKIQLHPRIIPTILSAFFRYFYYSYLMSWRVAFSLFFQTRYFQGISLRSGELVAVVVGRRTVVVLRHISSPFESYGGFRTFRTKHVSFRNDKSPYPIHRKIDCADQFYDFSSGFSTPARKYDAVVDLNLSLAYLWPVANPDFDVKQPEIGQKE